MRGLRSTIALARRPRRPRRLHLLRHLEAAERQRRIEAGEGVRGRSSRQDRRAEGQVRVGRRDDAQEGRRRRGRSSHRRGEGRRSRGRRASRARSSAIEIERVIDENPTDLKDYGLDTPRIEVDFKAADGKTIGTAARRRQDADRRQLFARRNDEKRVFLIPEFQESSLNKTTFDLRDKTVIKFDREKVDGVEVDGRRHADA